jgi:hypothetical protein
MSFVFRLLLFSVSFSPMYVCTLSYLSTPYPLLVVVYVYCLGCALALVALSLESYQRRKLRRYTLS